MYIVHVVLGRPKPDTANGVLQSVYYLSVQQGKCGHNVHVLSLRGKKPEKSKEIAKNVNVHFFKCKKIRFAVDKQIVSFLSTHFDEIDIVHFHSAYQPEYWTITKILRKYEIPYVISPRGSYQRIANKRNFIVKKLYKTFFEMSIIKNARIIHALNAPEAAEMQDYGVLASKVCTIPNGVDVERITDIRKSIEQISPDQFTLAYCGRLDAYYKGLDILLRAVHCLIHKKKITNIRLMLIGPDWKHGRRTLEKLVDDLALHDCVVFCGAKFGLEKYQLYSMSSAFILTSRTEGMPTAVLEAMAFGLPCIVTPETNVDPQIMENGGCLFVDLSISDIVSILELAISDERALQLIGIKGKEWVLEHYNYSRVANQHIEMYENIIRSRT